MRSVRSLTVPKLVRRRWRWLVAAALLVALGLLLRGGWFSPEDPSGLLRTRFASTRVLDRHGQSFRAIKGAAETRARWVNLHDIAPVLVAATLAAEDRRFFDHPGVDPLAVARAIWGNLRAGRVTSGASTLTQQIVKWLQPRSRRLGPKLVEAVVALNLEARHDKTEILQWYLNYAPYGGLLRGCEEAAQTLFGKPARDLTLAEAAYLAVLPRSPTRLDPLRDAKAAIPMQIRLLKHMAALGLADRAAVDAALDQPVHLAWTPKSQPIPHLSEWLLAQTNAWLSLRPVAVLTSLDGAVQQDLQQLVKTHISRLRDRHVGNGAVVVLDTQSRELIALIGSADYSDLMHLGANNGATALRQPGSTIKAFAYATAFERGLGPSTVLPDLPASFDTPQGPWTPGNYGGHFYGPMRARLALANSLNLASVQLLARIGTEALRDKLAQLGFVGLAQAASHYGLGLTLGDGEVTLVELTNGFATLADSGVHKPLRVIQSVQWSDGAVTTLPEEATRAVFTPQSAWLVGDILRDPRARALAFGRDGPLELPFACMAKTGTSKGFRDNWAVGATPKWTVGVWVGNFDGSPMDGVSGITGAAPLLRDVLLRLVGDSDSPEFEQPQGLESVRICALSGGLAGPHCPQLVDEWRQDHEIIEDCRWHQAIAIDPRNGLRAGPGCVGSQVQEKIFALLPDPYRAWALQHLPQPPLQGSPNCPLASPLPALSEGVRIVTPHHHAIFFRDSQLDVDAQQIALLAHGQEDGELLQWFCDSLPLGTVRSGQALLWPVELGAHHLKVKGLRGTEDWVDIEVRAGNRHDPAQPTGAD